MLAAATPAVEDEETEDEDVLIDFEVLKSEMSHFRHRFVQMLMRILGCTSLKRLLEAACVKALDVKTAGRLVKDPVKSALRKAARCGRATAAGKMLKTASYAQCLTYAANLIVAEAGLLWKYFFDHDATTTTESPAGRRQRRTVYLSKASSVAVGYGAA